MQHLRWQQQLEQADTDYLTLCAWLDSAADTDCVQLQTTFAQMSDQGLLRVSDCTATSSTSCATPLLGHVHLHVEQLQTCSSAQQEQTQQNAWHPLLDTFGAAASAADVFSAADAVLQAELELGASCQLNINHHQQQQQQQTEEQPKSCCSTLEQRSNSTLSTADAGDRLCWCDLLCVQTRSCCWNAIANQEQGV
jgi:hypothetical protein